MRVSPNIYLTPEINSEHFAEKPLLQMRIDSDKHRCKRTKIKMKRGKIEYAPGQEAKKNNMRSPENHLQDTISHSSL